MASLLGLRYEITYAHSSAQMWGIYSPKIYKWGINPLIPQAPTLMAPPQSIVAKKVLKLTISVAAGHPDPPRLLDTD